MTKERRAEPRGYDGIVDIYNPIIADITPGNMIRIREPGREKWGVFVLEVDYKKEQILVRANHGGTLQFDEWTHISNVHVTWNIGTIETVLTGLDELADAVNDLMTERAKLGID